MIKGKTMAEIAVGDSHSHEFTVTAKMIEAFAEATGDRNPVHLDEEFARTSIFKTRVAHGMLSAGFISAVLGNMFPGVGTIYLSQSLQFRKPVFIGDRITARLTAVEKIEDKNRLRLETVCTNQNGDKVVIGEALVMPPGA
jgi:3-hydroxybutyryl-CoA dehydratase